MRFYPADLHIHTALSPCAENEMTPPAIIKAAKMKGLEIIGICDHNSAENVAAVMEAGAVQGITVIGGIEVQTVEDIHVLTLFPHMDPLLSWQREIYSALPWAENDEERFGEQLVMDSSGRITRKLHHLLLASTSLGIDYVGRRVGELGGLIIPSHVDRPSFSLIRNLGFVPDGLSPECLEISRNISVEQARVKYPSISGYHLIRCSDAHRLDEISDCTCFYMDGPEWDEILLALRRVKGRYAVPKESVK